jgi:hypothetical protein
MIEQPLFDLPPVTSPAAATERRRAAPAGARQSAFEKDALNRYDTIDPRAVAALLPHLPPRTHFIEPCAGKGDLVRQLQLHGHLCVKAFDIAPRAAGIGTMDARQWKSPVPPDARPIITNPPYDWPLLAALLENWRQQVAFSWVLLEATFMHTRRGGPVM